MADGASITRSTSRVMAKERMLSVCGDHVTVFSSFDVTAPYILVCVYGIAVLSAPSWARYL